MKTQIIRQFLKPDGRKLFLLVIFIAIMVGGQIQAWTFSDVPPKPPLYDLLRPIRIWPVWMFLLAPLALIVLPLRLIGIDIMGGPSWLFLITNFVYFYMLSCLIIAGFGWVRSKLILKKVQ
jgi:hypothetical protein